MTNEADRRSHVPAGAPGPAPPVLRAGGVVCPVRTWPGRPSTAYLVMYQQARLPTGADLERWNAELAAVGFTHVRTSALALTASLRFEAAGYAPVQELVLLEHTDPRGAAMPSLSTRRLHPEDHGEAAGVDRAAFGDEWALDAAAIADVCAATPRHRARCAGDPMRGFALTGRDARQGFLQRLAVAPEHQRAGIATALVLDSLGWLARWRVQRVLVNTPTTNEPALALYERLGFTRLQEQLRVYERAIA